MRLRRTVPLLLACTVFAAGCGLRIVLPPLPPAPGPEATPTPSPEPTPDPVPIPDPAPSPVDPPALPPAEPSPAPAAGCRAPQEGEGGAWIAIPDSEYVTPVACGEVNRAIQAVTACNPGAPCPLGDGRGYDGPPKSETGYQVFFDRVATQLRDMGLCAGQHLDGRQDGIAVARSLEGRPIGTWDEQHIVAYNTGSAIWCRGPMKRPPEGEKPKPNGAYKAAYRWVPDGSSPAEPSPAPGASPTPAPTPKPPPPASRVELVVTGEARSGGTLRLECQTTPRDAVVSQFYLHTQLGGRGGLKGDGVHFEVTGQGHVRVVKFIKERIPAGVLVAFCRVGEYGNDVLSKTVRIAVAGSAP